VTVYLVVVAVVVVMAVESNISHSHYNIIPIEITSASTKMVVVIL